MINYGKHKITIADVFSVCRAMLNDNIARGENIKKFEHEVAAKSLHNYGIAFSNATVALTETIRALKIRGAIITSNLTFIADTNAILLNQCTPVYVDIDDTITLDPVKVKEAILHYDIKAILLTLYNGNATNVEAIAQLAKLHNIPLIIDNAHGAPDVNTKLANATIYSYHPVKLITTGEGGMVVTDDAKLSQTLRQYRDNGRIDGHNLSIGTNGWMSELNATLGLSQFKRIDSNIKKRQALADYYHTKLDPKIKTPNGKVKYHIFPILINNRSELILKLKAQGYQAQVHYDLCTNVDHAYIDLTTETTKNIAKQILTLPLYLDLSKASIRKISKIVNECFRK